MDRNGKLSLGQLPEITTLEIQERDGRSDGELKVSEALARTCKKSPGQRRREIGSRTGPNTTSKCPGLVPRAGAKDFLVMSP